jgi:adenosylcobinamide-GDP ribazoletransferase
MKNFRSAIRFMTILPAGGGAEFDAAAMVPWFPMVGLLIGGLLALFDSLAVRWWSLSTVGVLEVALLALVTGAFHLDGLGDSADGLFSHRPRERMLEIMKDSRTGAMGVVAIVLVLAIKWVGLGGIQNHRPLLLILVPAYARCGILLAMRLLPYGRPGGGTGLAFFSRPVESRRFWGVAVVMLLSLGIGIEAVWLNAAFLLMAGAIIAYFRRRLNCVTGDMLGAMTEVTEAGLFLLASMGGGR